MLQSELKFGSKQHGGSRTRGNIIKRRSGAVTLGLLALAASLMLTGCQGASTVAPAPRSVPVSSTPPALTPSKPHNVVVIGDSLSTGLGTSPKDAWPNLIDNDPLEGAEPLSVHNVAQNGSGYLSVGSHKSTFGSQVQQGVDQDTDLVVFFGSENDRGYAPEKLTNAMTDAYAAAKEKAPHAAMLVVGPPAYSHQPEARRLSVRDAVQDAAEAAGAKFVDPIAQGWIVDDVENLVGPDGVHPSLSGQYDLKAKMETLIANVLPQ
ncbi:hypothetical protein GCM10023166_02780 [Paeniglutamicibacter cryotolerans]